MIIPDLHNLSSVLHKSDEYHVWEKEYLSRLSEKEKISFSEASLFHNLDQFDSSVFQIQVGKVESVLGDDPNDIEKVVQHFFNHMPYDYCLFRVAQQHIRWIQQFEQNGAILLDSTVDLVCDLSKLDLEDELGSRYVTSEIPTELRNQVVDISNAFHHGRFFTDPDFQNGRAMYREWIENSLKKHAADEVYVYKKSDKIHGLITVKNGGFGRLDGVRIPLVGKHPDSSEHHVAQVLLRYVMTQAKKRQKKFLLISTQATNIPALRSYIAAGCLPYSAETTLGWYKKRS